MDVQRPQSTVHSPLWRTAHTTASQQLTSQTTNHSSFDTPPMHGTAQSLIRRLVVSYGWV